MIYIIHASDEFETGALDFDHQGQIGHQTSAPPTLVVKLSSQDHVFTFFTSQKPPVDCTSFYFIILPGSRPSLFVKIIIKFCLKVLCLNFENKKSAKNGYIILRYCTQSLGSCNVSLYKHLGTYITCGK